MRIVAGMDEAGYGPLLGPLVVCCWAIEVRDADSDATDLWSRLATAVCRRPNDKKGRIAIDDSKTLKGSKDAAAHPLRHLERGALAALGAMLAGEGGVPIPESEDALLQRVSLDAAPSRCATHAMRWRWPPTACAWRAITPGFDCSAAAP
jgi:hypothetical protein